MKVLTLGTFDILHFGHIAFLRACTQLAGGEQVTVGLNTDTFVWEYKGLLPVMTYDERAHALEQLRYTTIPNPGPGQALIEVHRAGAPLIVAVGSDWARRDYHAQIGVTQDWLDERRITVAYIPYVLDRRMSTSEIRRRILDGAH